MSVEWPASLPLPQFGLRYNLADPQMRTLMASGRTISRRKFSYVPTEFSARWMLSTAEASVFEQFYQDDAVDGTEWIEMPLVTPQGEEAQFVRFRGAYSYRRVGSDLWEYSANLQMGIPADSGGGGEPPIGTDRMMVLTGDTNSPYMNIWNSETYAQLTNVDFPPTSQSRGCAFNNAGTLLAVTNALGEPRLNVYDIPAKTKKSIPISTEVAPVGPFACKFSPNDLLCAVAGTSSPFLAIYNTATWTKIANPSTLPAGAARDCAFNPAGTLLAYAHSTSPRITIYNTSTWAKLANPSTLPPNNGTACSFNHDGSLLAVGHSSSPFITVYETSAWAKLTNPSTLPPNTVNGCVFSPDGSFLAVCHNGSVNIATIYSTSGGVLTLVAQLPADFGGFTLNAHRCRFNPEGTKLYVLINSTPFMRVYETTTWTQLPAPPSYDSIVWLDVCFSPFTI